MTNNSHLPPTVAAKPRRQHPARLARTAALVVSVAATGGIAAGMAAAESDDSATDSDVLSSSAASSVAGTSASTTDSESPESESASSTTVAEAASAGEVVASGWADGTYLGSAEYTEWGDVQVEVTISGGQISDIVTMQVPDDRKSSSINGSAVPILEAEAIAEQGSDLDVVSGATYTSGTYAASLQSALDAAAGVEEQSNNE